MKKKDAKKMTAYFLELNNRLRKKGWNEYSTIHISITGDGDHTVEVTTKVY